MNNQGEAGYLDMLRHIMANGVDKSDRTGTGTREVFVHMLRFDMSDGTFPVMTTKKTAWKTAIREMLWMLSGSGNIRPLLEQNVHIWSEWPHARYVRETGEDVTIKEFEKRILESDEFAEKWGDTGGAYGVQWRHWAHYEPVEGEDGLFRRGPDVDQISDVLHTLRTNPDSRRIIFTAWNPPVLSGMMLPPCHMTYQFQVSEGKLNLVTEIRSWDTLLGAPFNIVNSAALLMMMAKHSGLELGELVMVSVCTHIYSNHFEQVAEQLTRDPRPFPRMRLADRDDFFSHEIGDFTLEGYDPHPAISAPVAV